MTLSRVRAYTHIYALTDKNKSITASYNLFDLKSLSNSLQKLSYNALERSKWVLLIYAQDSKFVPRTCNVHGQVASDNVGPGLCIFCVPIKDCLDPCCRLDHLILDILQHGQDWFASAHCKAMDVVVRLTIQFLLVKATQPLADG